MTPCTYNGIAKRYNLIQVKENGGYSYFISDENGKQITTSYSPSHTRLLQDTRDALRNIGYNEAMGDTVKTIQSIDENWTATQYRKPEKTGTYKTIDNYGNIGTNTYNDNEWLYKDKQVIYWQ
jgi:hypothetical protein